MRQSLKSLKDFDKEKKSAKGNGEERYESEMEEKIINRGKKGESEKRGEGNLNEGVI